MTNFNPKFNPFSSSYLVSLKHDIKLFTNVFFLLNLSFFRNKIISLFVFFLVLFCLPYSGWGQFCTPDRDFVEVTLDADGNLVYSQPEELQNDTGEECCDGTASGNVDCVAIKFTLPAGIDETCLFSTINFQNDQGNIYVSFVDEDNTCSQITEYGNNSLIDLISCDGGAQSIVICKPGNLTVSPTVNVNFKCEVNLAVPAGQTLCHANDIPSVTVNSTADFSSVGGSYAVNNLAASCGACNVVDADLTDWQVSDVSTVTDPCLGGTITRTYSALYCGRRVSGQQVFTIDASICPQETFSNEADYNLNYDPQNGTGLSCLPIVAGITNQTLCIEFVANATTMQHNQATSFAPEACGVNINYSNNVLYAADCGAVLNGADDFTYEGLNIGSTYVACYDLSITGFEGGAPCVLTTECNSFYGIAPACEANNGTMIMTISN